MESRDSGYVLALDMELDEEVVMIPVPVLIMEDVVVVPLLMGNGALEVVVIIDELEEKLLVTLA